MGERGGGGKVQLQLACVILPGASALGRAGGWRGGIRPRARCSLLTPTFALCLSFSYLHSAAGVSFDIKKARGKPYSTLVISITEL
jgi:hypothetical protein